MKVPYEIIDIKKLDPILQSLKMIKKKKNVLEFKTSS